MQNFSKAMLGAALSVGLAAPAMAESEPSTRVVNCASGSCLLVSGNRASTRSAVSINGYVVPVKGGRRWHARMPVETVRAWSPPYARTITVAVDGVSAEADLPIGLLGHSTELSMLVVRVK